MALSEEQRLFYEANGYLVIREALTGDELATVKAAADRAEAKWRADKSRAGNRSDTLEQVQAPIEYEDELLHLLWHPTIFPLVRELVGEDVQMIDNDFFITPPHTPKTHAGWHHDVNLEGVYHPRSTVMVKVFFLLSDVNANSGGTAMIPGSHRFPMDFSLPNGDPRETPGAIQMTGKAGDAYLFNGRVYHAAVNNDSDHYRRVLIYNYGHFWMKMWPGYEPSENVKAKATTRVQKQLLGIGDAYMTSLRGES
jgi:ectoine hydroxylase-related dioxygenase (phytanoyl-CoA dioxygenase family)